MQLPELLEQNIQKIAESGQLDYEQLSRRYREGGAGFQSQAERLAYLVARMPATFAALMKALEELQGLHIESLTDWGAGPGTGFWAAGELFPHLRSAVLIERDREMVDLGKRLAEGTKNCEWISGDLLAVESPSDLALFSYSLGEIPKDKRASLLLKVWKSCKVLLIVEPGTPRGYQNVIEARDLLIAEGGHLIAPCPHRFVCPMMGKETWCHFPARVERTRAHRLLKGGKLGHEDEKFSYVAFSKEGSAPFKGRIVGHPQKLSGHVKLTLCMENGHLEEKTISKRQKEIYKWARKAEWGEKCSEDLM